MGKIKTPVKIRAVQPKAKQGVFEKLFKEKRLPLLDTSIDDDKDTPDPEPTKLYGINPIKPKRFTRDWIQQKILFRFHRSKLLLIHMELRNGDHDQFVVAHQDGSFQYGKGDYLIDEACRYYHIPTGMYAMDYHEAFSLPIKRTIDVGMIKNTIEQSGVSEVELQTNPTTLARFIESKIAEGVMKGQQIDDFLRSLKMLIIINVVIGAITLILFVAKTGILQSVHIPGLGG